MAKVLYMRVSTKNQTTASQEEALKNEQFDKTFADVGVSGAINALNREEFKKCFEYLREGDTVTVYDIDRLGRNAIDVMNTVVALREKGVEINIHRQGITVKTERTPMGDMLLNILATMAEMEREKIKDRQKNGIARAKAEGKQVGARKKVDYKAVYEYKLTHSATETAKHFNISVQSVKRINAEYKKKLASEE